MSIALVFIIACVGIALSFANAKTIIKFYVSNSGNDNNSGTLSLPFKTLEKARDSIRELKANGHLNSPVIVYIRKGVYRLDKAFELDERDSGTAENMISYRAYPEEKVFILGAKKLNLDWQKYNNNIYVANVSDFIDQYGNFNSLFVDWKEAQRAKTPNTGYFKVKDFVSPVFLI